MLERYAKEKEYEFKKLIGALMNEFKRNELTEAELHLGIKKAFQLGHHAGHCRGEMHKTKTFREWAR